ncbi:hypothetical protein CMO91_02870 [Candidatus Woesearchaeota archaeon]|nr:hypothetical protein [Candidatus Woesearchaeota archaeon]|tara:strand:+ start:773 stop:1039 length:267 start_codon:yes stop_codon:yes gene_type:complete
MVKLKVRIGPKGQVVIPKPIRDQFKLFPGQQAVWDTTAQGPCILPEIEDPVEVFEEMAKRIGRKNFKYDKKRYDEQYAERFRSAGLKP